MPAHTDADEARMIALDWGTTSLRTYLLGESACTLEQRSLPLGVMQLHKEVSESSLPLTDAFESAFDAGCGDWARKMPSLPVVAAGMVGSAEGWREAPYLDVPLALAQLGSHLTRIRTTQGSVFHVVPGLIQRTGLGNVMRGEETQVLGAIAACSRFPSEKEILFGLPGTHSKWGVVSHGFIQYFETFLTGEVYGALCEHTILGRNMHFPATPDVIAFERGARVAASPVGKAGVLSSIFSVRTLGLMNSLSPEQQSEYLSGVLIGHEVDALPNLRKEAVTTGRRMFSTIVLAGQQELCDRYLRVLKLYGYQDVQIADRAIENGLWQVALQAGLIS